MAASIRRAVTRLRESTGDFYCAVRADFAPLPSLDLHTFATPDDMARFQVTTDRVLGGRTECGFGLKAYTHFVGGVFSGTIEYADDNPDSRGGFAAFRTKPDERERDLTPFQAVEMRVKTDGRRYVANFKSATHSPEHLWQMAVMTEPYAWVTVALPFSQLVLTRRGRVDIAQSPLARDRVNGFGVLLADAHNGPFKFEVQWVRAIRDFHPNNYDAVPAYALEERASAQARRAAGAFAAQSAPQLPADPASRAAVDAEAGKQKLLAFYKQQKEAAKA